MSIISEIYSKALAPRAIKSLALATMLTASLTAAAQDAPMTVKAKADSTVMVMGDRVHVNVEVVKNGHEGVLVDMPRREADYHGMEMIDCVSDSADLGNGRVQLTYHFTFQAFDPSELLTLPPFRYTAAGDTARSEILTFKVMPVELSPELGDPSDIENLTIHGDEQVQDVRMRWYDYIPSWLVWVIIACALAALAATLYALYKKNGPQIFTPRKPVPPYEKAIAALQKLKQKNLIEKGLGKQYFTELTDIWRTYLNGRFGIQAMEMTSRQILRELRANEQTRLTTAQMEEILEISDFVKFAGLSPTREDMLKAYSAIYDFVEKTRPVPEGDGTAEDPKTAAAASAESKKPN